MQQQFETHAVRKRYLAQVRGRVSGERFSCDVPIGAQAGDLGSRALQNSGQAAHTQFRLLLQQADSALVEAIPKGGRTHQIRLHLAHLGHPVIGDSVYGSDSGSCAIQRRVLTQPHPLHLHAWDLTLLHPRTGNLLRLVAELPKWAEGYEPL